MTNLMNDEKHYITLNNYLKSIYHEKVFKISLNGNFSCPNRDGTLSKKGCYFCSSLGSGDFAGNKRLSIRDQFYDVLAKMEKKWPNGSYIAYFQANTNTYGTVDELKARYEQIITNDGPIDKKIKILSIATRPDCINQEIANYLGSLNKKIKVWVELGFQTVNEETSKSFNRGYNNDAFERAVKLLKEQNIEIIVHIINGLPNETKDDMLKTILYLNKFPINGIKIHMLHIIKDSIYGSIFNQDFKLLTLEEYVDIVTTQLYHLRKDIVVHRVTGDADKNNLIAPLWTLKKFVVMNEIDKKMRKDNLYQGDLYVQNS